MKIRVSEVQVPKERLRLLGDYSELAESMSGPVGQINPITVTPLRDPGEAVNGCRYRLVSGNHRLQAAQLNGQEFIEATVKVFEHPDDEVLVEIDENLEVVRLSAGEESRHRQLKHAILLQRGQALERGHRADYRRRESDTMSTSENFADVKTQPEIALAAGRSPRSERMIRNRWAVVHEHINARLREWEPKIFTVGREYERFGKLNLDDQLRVLWIARLEQLKGKDIGVFEAQRIAKRMQTRRLAEQVQEPTGKYRTIVIDAPWSGEDSGDVDPFNKLAPAYPTMSLEEIRNLPVPDLAMEDDCHLYLWVTDRMLKHGLELMEHYGFRYIQTLAWRKHRLGTGRYYRHQHELVLFGLRGTRLLARTDASSIFEGNRGDHSAKPEQFFELVRSCSPGPRLSMFDRTDRDGFDTWGTLERSEQSSMVRAG